MDQDMEIDRALLQTQLFAGEHLMPACRRWRRRMTMPYPTNFGELVEFLTRNRRIQCEHWIPEESYTADFAHVTPNGHLCFTTLTGRMVHTPCGGPCGPGDQEPVLRFHPRGFTVEMFGKTVRYYYAGGSHAEEEN